MALKTEKVEKTPEPVKPNTTVLELAMYTQYTWQGETYEKGKPYRFKTEDAMQLLAETDTGRPIWKLYQAPKPRVAPKNEVVDATGVKAGTLDAAMGMPPASRRIDVGDDSEIKDILEGGDITV